mgnify:CR=1 FL=1
MSGSGPIDSEKDGKKMKIRKYILCAGIVGLVGLSSGCGQKTDSGATSQAVSEQADTKENAETSGAAGAETEKETDKDTSSKKKSPKDKEDGDDNGSPVTAKPEED